MTWFFLLRCSLHSLWIKMTEARNSTSGCESWGYSCIIPAYNFLLLRVSLYFERMVIFSNLLISSRLSEDCPTSIIWKSRLISSSAPFLLDYPILFIKLLLLENMWSQRLCFMLTFSVDFFTGFFFRLMYLEIGYSWESNSDSSPSLISILDLLMNFSCLGSFISFGYFCNFFGLSYFFLAGFCSRVFFLFLECYKVYFL